jgi:ABC-type phosphate/phosphonate transport system substrate-binding protein
MIASLPMYDFPEVRDATDALWRALAERLGEDILLHRSPDHHAPWKRGDLLFSQTCGYPFTHEFRGQLNYVATAHYSADGCDGANYCSILLAREAKPVALFCGSVAAINAHDSMSGMLALKLAVAPYMRGGSFFKDHVLTGSHAASLVAVQQGHADLCAIDCITLALMRRYRPLAAAGLVEVERSPSVPGLPFVTRGTDADLLRVALMSVFADQACRGVLEMLLISGLSVLAASDYDVILGLEQRLETQSRPDGVRSC